MAQDTELKNGVHKDTSSLRNQAINNYAQQVLPDIFNKQ